MVDRMGLRCNLFMKLRWRFGILAGVILALFMLYPQARLIYLRGPHWQGNYAIVDADEVAYGAYLQSLIDGKSRRNDSFTKLVDAPGSPQPETFLSIQFVAAYAIAFPARIIGVSAPAAMTIAGVLAAFLTALSVFWLIALITEDSLYALAGSLLICCGGALAAGEGAILAFIADRPPGSFFPGFRRYVPVLVLPVMFAFFGLIWLMISTGDQRRRLLYGSLALLCFGLAVFSYFYVWTTMAAWLVCVVALWLIVRPHGWAKDSRALLILGAGCLVWLIPYAVLLSYRAPTSDSVQLVELSHATDLRRIPEYIGIAVLVTMVCGIWRKRIVLKEKSTTFVAGLALLPVAVHNQQVITGKVLQPIHYDVFAVNYVVILATVLACWLLFKRRISFQSTSAQFALAIICLVSVAWGLIECRFNTKAYDRLNIERDQGFEAGRYLRYGAGNRCDVGGTVFSNSFWSSDDLPTLSPKPILWAFHQIVFGGVSIQENKERYYQQLYYQNVDAKQLKQKIKDGDLFSIIALFGWGRFSGHLSSNFKPLTDQEIDEEIQGFDRYVSNFDPKNSPQTVLCYAVINNKRQIDFSVLDRWYQREAEEVDEDSTLYRLRLRESE